MPEDVDLRPTIDSWSMFVQEVRNRCVEHLLLRCTF